jgi:periplasmic divalent cation tolerance protein
VAAREPNYAAIEALIRVMHSYETPEVLAIPVLAGSRIYLEWIEAETQG